MNNKQTSSYIIFTLTKLYFTKLIIFSTMFFFFNADYTHNIYLFIHYLRTFSLFENSKFIKI